MAAGMCPLTPGTCPTLGLVRATSLVQGHTPFFSSPNRELTLTQPCPNSVQGDGSCSSMGLWVKEKVVLKPHRCEAPWKAGKKVLLAECPDCWISLRSRKV